MSVSRTISGETALRSLSVFAFPARVECGPCEIMIARLLVVAQFPIYVPSIAKFNVFESEVDGCKVRFFAPRAGAPDAKRNEMVKVTIDGAESIRADLIQIDFFGRTFDAGSWPPTLDPSVELVQKVLDSYIARLRRVTDGGAIHPLPFPNGIWILQYLNDDGSALSREEGKPSGVGASFINSGAIALTEKGWDNAHDLPPNYVPPAWETLLLDASQPGIPAGSAIVLAATALEVFIAYVLDNLAKTQTTPAGLWEWITNRNDFQKEPSVEEQYGILLKFYCGHSLKEDSRLWEAFKNLKSIRNTFVHEGIIRTAAAGKGFSVKPLVTAAEEIIERVSEWLPADLAWAKGRNDAKMRYAQPIFPF